MLATNRHNTSHTWAIDIIGLALFFIALYTLWLGHYPLFIPDEGRYGEVAREMLATGDFITPRVNGVAFLDKPILYYWLQAAGMYLFGVNEWAVRFFPAMLSIFGCVYTYVCGRHLFDRRTGILSAVILALTPLYFGGAHYADLNMEVAVFISCTLLSFITGVLATGTKRTAFLMAAYTFAALAFLTKGMIGIAFPSMIAGLTILLLWRWSWLKQIHLVKGLVLFTILALPWYVLVQQANPAFLHYFFVTQQVSRFLSAGSFNNPTPIWFYVPVVLIGFLPWTLFLIQALVLTTKRSWQQPQQNTALVFMLIWALVILVFFSVPTAKTVGYIFPIFPALALLTGYYLSTRWDSLKNIFYTLSAITIIGLIGLMAYSPQLNVNSTKPLAMQLNKIIQPDDEVVNYFKFFQDLPLYLQRRITLVADWNDPNIPNRDNWVRELSYGKEFQDTRAWLINEPEFWQRWRSKKRLFVFVNANQLQRFESQAKPYYIIGVYRDVTLVSNQRVTN